MIRVLIVEDDALYRRVIVLLLERQPDIEVVGEAGSLSDARRSGRSDPRPRAPRRDWLGTDRGAARGEPRCEGVGDERFGGVGEPTGDFAGGGGPDTKQDNIQRSSGRHNKEP